MRSPLPLHLAVRQLLALALQERGVGRYTWPEWLGDPFVLGPEVAAEVEGLIDHLLAWDFLFQDGGILGIGDEGRKVFGFRNFLDLMAVFSEPPMLKVLAGRTEIGQIPSQLLSLEAPDGHIVLLAGRNWAVRQVDWRRGVVQVEPTEDRGRARWIGDGQALSRELCQGIRRVLGWEEVEGTVLSRRAREKLDQLRARFSWICPDDGSVVVTEPDGKTHWWTFAGMHANLWLAGSLARFVDEASPGDLAIRLDLAADPAELEAALLELTPSTLTLGAKVAAGAVERLKFAEALPESAAERVVVRRMRDDAAVQAVVEGGVRVVRG